MYESYVIRKILVISVALMMLVSCQEPITPMSIEHIIRTIGPEGLTLYDSSYTRKQSYIIYEKNDHGIKEYGCFASSYISYYVSTGQSDSAALKASDDVIALKQELLIDQACIIIRKPEILSKTYYAQIFYSDNKNIVLRTNGKQGIFFTRDKQHVDATKVILLDANNMVLGSYDFST